MQAKADDIARLFPAHHASGNYILSKTVPAEELESLARQLDREIQVVTEDFDRFYSQAIVRIGDQQEAVFDNGRARVPIPQVDAIKHCSGHYYYWVDIELPEYELPRLNTNSWGQWLIRNYRVSKSGLSFIERGNIEKYVEFVVPSPWEMLEAFAEDAGYEVQLSDKGSIAERLIQLVGGGSRVWLLSGRTVYDLFDRLSELSQAKEFKARLRDKFSELGVRKPDDLVDQVLKEIASDRHERVLQQFSAIKDTLRFEKETAKSYVNWLIERGLILRGIELQCPICKTKQWLYIDNLQSRMQCIGCQETVNIPLSVDITHWQFRINTLYAKAHEQGVIPHLLTLNYATQQDPYEVGRNQGIFPGIKLVAMKGVDVPILEIEVDVAWIEGGKLVIGECKTHARDLSADEVSRYLDIAERMKCRRVVFSVLDDLESVDSEIEHLISSASIPVLFLSGEQLFNQYQQRQIFPHNESADKIFQQHVEEFFEREHKAR